jgi:hypothetical protein
MGPTIRCRLPVQVLNVQLIRGALDGPAVDLSEAMKQVNPLYAIVMGMDDATLSLLQKWLRRVALPLSMEGEERTRVATRAREWRDRRRGRPPRPVTNWKTATVCALANHPLTPENVRIAPNGQRSCRLCLNQRIREWRKKRRVEMTSEFALQKL